MNEPELRALVRDVIARHVGTNVGSAPGAPALEALHMVRQHASHAMFAVPFGSDVDGPCLIEPAVLCNHCGYCRSLGH